MMRTQSLLTSLFQFKTWANDELFATLVAWPEGEHEVERRTAVLLLDHAYVVDQIFGANLQRRRHGYSTTGTANPPALEVLRNGVRDADRWYVEYVSGLRADEFEERIEFVFTDGAQGRMSREKMFVHVITHGGYHRGEMGRILSSQSMTRPREILTGYFHKVEPHRRELA
jgi:uncharacterized damage-inducible protein DinB